MSLSCQSTGKAARKIPDSPPIVNTAMKPTAQSIGVSKEMFPRQSVASQLKIFTPVGTAMIIELIMKKESSPVGRPTANMWCAHTISEKNAIPIVDHATAA